MHQQYHLTKSMLPTVQPFWQGRSVFHSLILVYEVSFPTNQPKHPLHCPSPYSQQSFSHMPLSEPMDLWCFHLFAILSFGGLLLTKPPKTNGIQRGCFDLVTLVKIPRFDPQRLGLVSTGTLDSRDRSFFSGFSGFSAFSGSASCASGAASLSFLPCW